MSYNYEALQQKGNEWMRRASDSLVAEPWVGTFWTPDCVLQFSNAPEVTGRGAIMEFFSSQFPHLESMKHSIVGLGERDHLIYLRSSITYRAKGDPEHKDIIIPAFAVFFFPDELTVDGGFDKMSRFEVYLNPAPLQERIAEIMKSAGEGPQ
ncbi:hypothetical protein K523DRAFT_245100 [Schizophyllum commune Tattone D]|nr:hypothetical protein K523DRAFT_245100 [Schizophyllum commune Tattone D]